VNGHFVIAVDLAKLARERGAQARPFARVAGYVAGADGVCAEDPAEAVLDAYTRHGDGFAAHALGQYGAVVVDPARGSAVLAQDSLGVRPLFFHRQGENLRVASRLDLLTRELPELALDDAYFADCLGRGQVLSARTPRVGVERLSMGDCALTAAGAETKVFRPWAPAPRGVPVAGDLEAELRRLLDEAILACLPARGAVACELSGGLDSTTVLAFARKRRETQAITFASTAHPDADDVRFAREAAQALGARQLTLDTDGQRVFDRAFAGEAPEPGSEMFAAKLAAIDRLLSDNGVEVLLTGWAGDVVFGSAAALPHHLADGLAEGAPWRSVKATLDWRRSFRGGPSWMRWFTAYACRSAWRHRLGLTLDVPDHSVALPAWLDSSFVRRMDLGARARAQWAPRVATPGAQYLWQTIFSIAAMHASTGRLALSVETRHPLLHRPLVEFLLSLDASLRHPGGKDRVLQRRALKGLLPEAIRRRRTKGGMGGQIDRDIAADKALLRQLLDRPRLVARGYADPERWREAVSRAGVGATANRLHFDLSVSIELWLREHAPPATTG
jgi:asparagine synthase (glutamine-hydrolysing)